MFYATAISIVFNQEAFLIQSEFSAETEKETLCLVVSPSGTKTLQQALEEEIREYEAQFKAEIKPWAKDKPKQNDNADYLSNSLGSAIIILHFLHVSVLSGS